MKILHTLQAFPSIISNNYIDKKLKVMRLISQTEDFFLILVSFINVTIASVWNSEQLLNGVLSICMYV